MNTLITFRAALYLLHLLNMTTALKKAWVNANLMKISTEMFMRLEILCVAEREKERKAKRQRQTKGKVYYTISSALWKHIRDQRQSSGKVLKPGLITMI